MGHVFLRILPLLLLAAACATTAPSTGGRDREADGRGIYERSCARCHALYMPRSFTAGEWKYYVRKYGRKARLSSGEKRLVYDYLARNALGAAG